MNVVRFLCALTVLAALSLADAADANQGAPVYARGPSFRHGGARGFHGGVGFYGYPGFFAPPVITGSYYARPYPYHFDYYRWRYSAPPAPVQAPCAEAPAPY